MIEGNANRAVLGKRMQQHEQGTGAAEQAAYSAVRLAARLLHCPAAALALREDGVFRFAAWHGLSDEFVQQFAADSKSGLIGQVVQTKQPVRVDDIADPRIDANPGARKEGIRGTIVVPMLRDDEVIGCFFAGGHKPRTFTDQEEALLVALVQELLVFVDNGRQLEIERRARRAAQALLEVARAATTEESLRKVMARVATVAARYSVAERCSIFLYDPDTQALESFVSMFADGMPNQQLWEQFTTLPHPHISEIRGFVEAVQTQKPIYEGDVPNSDVIPRPWIEAFESASLIIYPMIVKDRVVGMMTLESTRPFPYPEDETETLKALAAQAGLVVEQVRLRRRIQQQMETDPLTGLPNRSTAQARLSEAFEKARAAGKPLAVLVADIDNMRVVNESHGSTTGDLALARIAEILQAVTPAGALAARWGGDEFLLALPAADSRAALATGRRILHEAARRALHLGPGREVVPLYMSIGVAHDDDCAGVGELLMRATRALDEAKLSGGHAAIAYGDGASATSPSVYALLKALSSKPVGGLDEAKQVAHHALLIASEFDLSAEERHNLRMAALLRDAGNLVVPDAVIAKCEPLTAEEIATVREHVGVTERILRGSEALAGAIEAAAAHHERWDGAGYPRGLKGDSIPLAGRIVAVADAYVAMRNARPYRPARSHSQTIAELRSCAGAQFDPTVVTAFIRALDTEARHVA